MKSQLSTEEVQQYFPGFAEPGLQQVIANQGRLHHFKEGDVVMDFGSYVRMSELFLYYLSRGESCTMTFSCCMADKKSEIRAIAEEDTVVLGLPQQYLDVWMMRYKSWKNFVMLAYDQRMNELIKTIDQVTFHQLDERLYDYLKLRANVREDKTINTTHQTIADDLHVSREAISRLLKGLEKRGIIELGRNRIELLQEL